MAETSAQPSVVPPATGTLPLTDGRELDAVTLLDLESFATDDPPALLRALWHPVLRLCFARPTVPAALRPTLLRMFGAQIGAHVTIGRDVLVLRPWRLTVGDRSQLGRGVRVVNPAPVRIARDVTVGPGAVISTHRRPGATPSPEGEDVHLGAGCWIGGRASVLRGATVAPGEAVLAGTVRTRH